MAPAWRVWRADLHERLKQGGQRSASDPSIGWLRSGLVVVQISLALVLLIGAGLALRSTYYLLHFGLKADPRRVLVVEVSLPKERYSDEAARLEFFEQAIARLNAWPSVEAAGAASFIAFRNGVNVPIVLEDEPGGEDAPARRTMACTVSPGFLDTIGVPLVRGRELNLQDRKGCPNVAVVEETMARRCWPGMDPLGKLASPAAKGKVTPRGLPWWGWCATFGQADLERAPCRILRALPQQSANIKTLVVRTGADPARMASRIQSLFREVDRSVPAPKVETLNHLLAMGPAGLASWRRCWPFSPVWP